MAKRFAGYFIVEDAEGARFKIRAFRVRSFFKSVDLFILGAAEKVKRIDDDTFEILDSGKTLVRVK